MNITFTKDCIELGNEWDILRKELLIAINNITTIIEEKYGPIDKNYSLTALNFDSKIKVPITQVKEVEKQVIIHLPVFTMQGDPDSKYQRNLYLSHELIHTITPCADIAKATYLDEGLATFFSEWYTNCLSGPPDRYETARNLVSKLLSHDKDIIKNLRTKYPNKKISDYKMQEIRDEFSVEITSSVLDLIQNLTKRINFPST